MASVTASAPVIAPVRPAFRALASTIVPEAAALDSAGWAEVESIIDEYLTRRPPALRRQLRLFIRALRLLPIIRYGRTFTALDAPQQVRFLEWVQDAPVLLVRRGFWGLRTMVYLGYYSRAAAAAEIGYRAHVRGWQARHSAQPDEAAGEERP